MADNTRRPVGPGDNQPDYALQEVSRLEVDYSTSAEIAQALLEEARALPTEIADDDTKGKYTSLIKRIRDHAALLESYHGAEKQPYLRMGQGVDQFFFGWIDKLRRRSKTGKAGALDILQARLTDYDTKILRAEEDRRRKIAEEQALVAREAAAKQAELDRQAEAARQAAKRARKPEKVAEKTAVADELESEARGQAVETELAIGKAEQAHVDTLAKPADIMRTRGNDGTLSTMASEPFAEVTDRDQLDKAKLWPFFTDEAIEKALRAWARTTGHKVSMPGASIGRRPKSVVR